LAKSVDYLKEQAEIEKNRLLRRAGPDKREAVEKEIADQESFLSYAMSEESGGSGHFKGIRDALDSFEADGDIDALRSAIEAETVGDSSKMTETKTGEYYASQFIGVYDELGKENPDITKAIEKLKELTSDAGIAQRSIDGLYFALEDTGAFDNSADIDSYIDSLEAVNTATGRAKTAAGETGKTFDAFAKEVKDGAEKDIPGFGDKVTAIATGLTGLASTISGVSNMFSTLFDPDVSGWEKFLTVLTTVATIIPTLTMTMGALKDAQIGSTLAKIADTLATKLNTKATRENADAKRDEANANEEATIT
jgi:hypothetical protein